MLQRNRKKEWKNLQYFFKKYIWLKLSYKVSSIFTWFYKEINFSSKQQQLSLSEGTLIYWLLCQRYLLMLRKNWKSKSSFFFSLEQKFKVVESNEILESLRIIVQFLPHKLFSMLEISFLNNVEGVNMVLLLLFFIAYLSI